MNQRRRTSRQRLEEIEASLDERDRQILELVGGFRVLTGRQLQRITTGGSVDFRSAAGRATRRRLQRLCQLDVLEQLERRIGGRGGGGSAQAAYVMGLVGQRLRDGRSRPRRYREPGWAFLDHTLLVGEVYTLLVERARTDPSFEILRFDPEPASWRQFVDRRGESISLRPDAYLEASIDGRRSHWFIEADRATEGRRAVETKMRRYLAYAETGAEQEQLGGVFPRMLWHCEDENRRQWLDQLCQQPDWPIGLHVTSGLIEEPP